MVSLAAIGKPLYDDKNLQKKHSKNTGNCGKNTVNNSKNSASNHYTKLILSTNINEKGEN